jgi:pimeloyl-ACP methyl ester carboxylesterase
VRLRFQEISVPCITAAWYRFRFGTPVPPANPRKITTVTCGLSDPSASLLNRDKVPGELLNSSEQRAGFEQEYPFRSCWFRTIDGVQHYVDEGTGPVILMVHGNPTWSFAWRKLIVSLRENYRVIAIDHLGCGFSEKPQDKSAYTLEGHIRRLASLVQLLDLRDVSLVGHDWGGAIGMGAAGRLEQRFCRFVLMNTGAFHSRAIPFRISLCRIPILGEIGDRALNLFARAAVTMAVETPLTPAARSGFLAPYDSWDHRIAVHEFVRDIPLSPTHRSHGTLTEVERSLEKFRTHPVQLIWGMKDWCFTPQEFLVGFQKRFPGATVLRLPDAGHYVFEDAPEQVLSQIRSFMS